MLDKLFNQSVLSLFKKNNIKACYFFGSQNNNSLINKGDYDIALFINDRNKINNKELLKQFVNVFRYQDRLHLLVVDLKNSSPVFLYQIIKKGTLVYEEKKDSHIVLESKILHFYFDDQYRNNIYYNFLRQKYANR